MSEKSINLFGVTIDCKLSFTEQISNICKKSGRQINILKLLSTVLDYNSKLSIYFSFIKSNFLYCSNVWYFCGVVNMRKILTMERRCLRFLNNDYENDYGTMLKINNIKGLQHVLLATFLTEVYKCINNIGPVYLRNLYVIKNGSSCPPPHVAAPRSMSKDPILDMRSKNQPTPSPKKLFMHFCAYITISI